MFFMLYVIPIILLIPIGIYFYFFFRRLLSLLHIHKQGRLSRVLAFILTAICVLSASRIAGIGTIIVMFLFVSCLITDGLNYIFKKLLKRDRFKTIWKHIYCGGMLAFGITILALGYGYFHAKDVVVTNYKIETSKESSSKSLKIAMISDLHMGTTMNTEELEKYCKQINESHPDILVLVGDIFDESTHKEDMKTATKLLGSINSNYGTYYVDGNHETGSHGVNPEFGKEDIVENLTGNGITVLEDEVTLVDNSFYLIGRKDASVTQSSGRKSVEELLEGVDKSKLLLLLDHQPIGLQASAQAGIDLQLSGHTHGGQIWPLGTISELLHINELNYGYKNIGKYQVIVSSGIGGWGYPIRTGISPEIAMIDVEHK